MLLNFRGPYSQWEPIRGLDQQWQNSMVPKSNFYFINAYRTEIKWQPWLQMTHIKHPDFRIIHKNSTGRRRQGLEKMWWWKILNSTKSEKAWDKKLPNYLQKARLYFLLPIKKGLESWVMLSGRQMRVAFLYTWACDLLQSFSVRYILKTKANTYKIYALLWTLDNPHSNNQIITSRGKKRLFCNYWSPSI